MVDKTENGKLKIFHKDLKTIQQHDVYLGETVKSSPEYYDLFNLLNEVDRDDTVIIHLNNFGGACHTGLQLIQAIRHCEATVITKVEAPVYSMGAVLALTGNILDFNTGAFLMFHNYSGGEFGKGNELQVALNASNKYIHNMFRDVCCPFLNKRELNKILNGHDLYVHADESEFSDGAKGPGFMERLQKLVDAANKK